MAWLADLNSPDELGLEALEQKITSLYAQRQDMIRQLKKCRQNRSDFLREIRELSSRVKSARADVDQVYRQLDSLVQTRREMLAKVRDVRGRINATRERVGGRDASRSTGTVEDFSDSVRSLEWKLQTESLTRDEEKALISQIKETTMKLRRLQKNQVSQESLSNLSSEMQSLKGGLDEVSMLKQSVEPQLQALRDSLQETVKMRDQVGLKIEEANVQISKLEEELERAGVELSDLKETRRRSIDMKRAAESEDAKRREAELLDRVRKEAKTKMAEGKKMTFDEWLLAFREDEDKSLK